MNIDISLDVKRATRNLGDAAKQVPFAAALAATHLAKLVQLGETEALPGVFDRPTPFTMRAFGVSTASKSSPQAEVFAKTIQAKYLEPSETGGLQVLGKGRAIRKPVDIRTNAYGNIPKGAIARRVPAGKLSTKGKRGFFIGVVNGVNALWQRQPGHHLKLLIAFSKPQQVSTRLDFQQRARAVVKANFAEVFGAALRRALKTAR